MSIFHPLIMTFLTLKGAYNALMVLIGAKVSKMSLKIGLICAIDKMKDKAVSCCKNGKFWKDCVFELAQKLYEWKVLGILPDPFLD